MPSIASSTPRGPPAPRRVRPRRRTWSPGRRPVPSASRDRLVGRPRPNRRAGRPTRACGGGPGARASAVLGRHGRQLGGDRRSGHPGGVAAPRVTGQRRRARRPRPPVGAAGPRRRRTLARDDGGRRASRCPVSADCQTSSAAPARATRCRASSAPMACPPIRSMMAVVTRPPAAIAARPGQSGRQPRADRADGERDGQRQVERAELVRGVHAGVMVVAEEQHRRRDRELRQGQRDKQAAPSQPQPPPVAGDGDGREHPGGEVMVEEGAAEPHPPGHRVRAALPVDAGGAACQVRLEHVGGQPRDLAVDLSRDGHADPCRNP